MDEQLITLLEQTATLLELNNENPFKVSAFANAARALEKSALSAVDIVAAVENGSLSSVQGIGKGLQETIAEYVQTGSITLYEDLKTQVPDGVLAMTTLRGLGAKKVRTLWRELGLTSIEELSTACLNDRIATLKGFGAKTQANILESIAQWKTAQIFFHLHIALRDADELLGQLRALPAVKQAELSGAARRFAEVLTELIFVVQLHSLFSDDFQEQILSLGFTRNGAAHGYYYGASSHGIPVRLMLATAEEFAWALVQTTGSPEYVERLNAACVKRSISLTIADEQSLYSAIGLPFVIPELREPEHCEQLFSQNQELLTAEYITTSQMRGVLHVHSTWSDGKNSIEEMALAAKELGHDYIAICDHSKSAIYANGLTEERVKRQHEEIDLLNTKNLGIRILKGIESDILADGSLDYADAVLDTFDVIVASVHSGFTMSAEAMTGRVIRALQHPHTTILGHPTGRLLLARKEYAIHLEEVMDIAAEYNKIIEINANPHRLDLTWRNAILAKQRGIRLAINTDAHNARDISFVHLGVSIARKAALQAADVINTLSLEDFLIFAKQH